jgi:VWFA-related protein
MFILPFSARLICITLAVLCLLLPAVQAQERQEKAEEQEGTVRINTELVSVDVIVTDRAGLKNAPALKAADFAIYEDGVPQKISSFSTAEVPFNLVLLIDTSGSTREDLDLMRHAARRFLNQLRPDDRVAVVAFHEEVELLQDLTSDRSRLEVALNRLPQGGGSAVYDAVLLSLQEVLKKIEGRKAIIMLSDGVDSFGYLTYEELLPEVERAGAALYFLEWDTEAFAEAGMLRDCSDDLHFKFSRKQLKKYYDAARASAIRLENSCLIPKAQKKQINHFLYEAARSELRTMADKTGGRVLPVKNLEQLDPAYAQIAAELRTQYSIAYYPTNDKRDGTWRKLRVEIKRPGWMAKARPGYRAPGD